MTRFVSCLPSGIFALAIRIKDNLCFIGRYLLSADVTTVLLVSAILSNPSVDRGLLKYLSLALLGLAVLVAVNHIVRTVATRDAQSQGIGYASPSWSGSPIIRAVKRLPANLAKRDARYIPVRTDGRTGVEVPASPHAKQVHDPQNDLALGADHVAFLGRIGWRRYLVSEKDLRAVLNLLLATHMPDRHIYQLSQAARGEGVR